MIRQGEKEDSHSVANSPTNHSQKEGALQKWNKSKARSEGVEASKRLKEEQCSSVPRVNIWHTWDGSKEIKINMMT